MTNERQFNLHDGRNGAALAIRVTPRASRNEVAEILDDGTVKIRLKAAGSDLAANQALLQFLAEILEIPADRIEIVAGQAGNDKLVTIMSLDTTTVQKRIIKKLA